MKLKEELEYLQYRLAEIDLFTRPSSRPSSAFTELLLVKLQDIKIKIYQERGHALPHVHIDYGKKYHIASFAIKPAARIEGSLSKKYDKAIISWITERHEDLLKIWSEMQQGNEPKALIANLSGSA
ncbi:DUF4160 domain-containing protein [Stutzerimonas nitrititolerans]|uniref:DUF4160 domain-containing protein n=1 Tax=Stutzerimonas nitrititolerans TaxID=2482751 RepID=UPI00289EF943|nr:DUF4160 domain-containing protein [Stutzerimonas nitrititolerans]